MRRFLRKFGFTVLGAILCVVLIALALFSSIVRSNKTELDQIQAQLIDLTRMEVDYIQTVVGDIRLRGVNLALAIAKYDDLTSPEIEDLFAETMLSSNVSDIFLTLPDGSIFFANRTGFEVASRMGINKSRNGEIDISEVYTLSDGRSVFGVTIPVYKGDEIVAILSGVYETALFARIANVTCFDGQGYIHIFQKDGRFVARSTHEMSLMDKESYFYIETATFGDGSSYEQLIDNIENGKSGFLTYTMADSERYAYYTPVEENDWYIITVVPTAVIQQYANLTNRSNLLLTVEIAAALLLFVAIIIFDARGRNKDLRLANERLNLSEERFRIAISHVSYLVFEYDYHTDVVHMLTDPDDDSLTAGRTEVYLSAFKQLIDAEDLELFEHLFEEVRSGIREGTVYIRMKGEDEADYRWYSLALSGIFDAGGRVMRAVGTLEDVNDQRTETLRLRERADADPLTGVYNRAATEHMINAIIDEGGAEDKYSFMVIDLDDFKDINDSLGHPYGDEVLQEVANTLVNAFRNTYVIGRLGGDEFSVFLKGVANLEIIRRKLRKPLAMLANPESHQSMGITLSIGVTFGTKVDDFDELYRRADIALYRAKMNGKSQIVAYEPEMEADIVQPLPRHEPADAGDE